MGGWTSGSDDNTEHHAAPVTGVPTLSETCKNADSERTAYVALQSAVQHLR